MVTTLQLIRIIAMKGEGERTEIAKRPFRTILQPRITHQAQFQRLTLKQWESVKVINKHAIRAITALARMTPIVSLQESGNMNTLTELLQNKESKNYSKAGGLGHNGEKRKTPTLLSKIN